MTNELIPVSEMPVGSIKPEDFKTEIATGGFLPRIQIVDSNSKLAKKNIVPAGNWALVLDAEKAEDLTNEINMLVIAARWKALDLNGEKPVDTTDKDSDLFKDIKNRASTPNSKCMWGPEFLIWLPAVEQYATYFCSSKTARRESSTVFEFIGKAATISAHLIENKDYAWFGPTCTACATPFDVPPKEQIFEVCNKFLNPPKSAVEVVPESDDGRER